MGKLIGTTRIELTDVHTGEKEVHDDHNMVTNALRDIFQPIGLCSSEQIYYKDLAPYYYSLLGGLLCFDTALDEDPDKYFPPTSASLVGCAVYNQVNSSDNPYRGNYNTSESEVNLEERYVKFVYDFATNQANGTISSVCLTHQDGGYTSYGGRDLKLSFSYSAQNLIKKINDNHILIFSGTNNVGANSSNRTKTSNIVTLDQEFLFLINRELDCAFYFKIADSKHIHITRRRTYLRSVSIFDTPATVKSLVEDKELPELGIELKTNQYMSYNYDHATKKLYICTSPNNLSSSGNITVTEIKYDTWEIKQYDIKNTTGVNIDNSYLYSYAVTNGYLYCVGYTSPYDIYKIELSNSANVTKIENKSQIKVTPSYILNGRIYYQCQNLACFVLNTETNEIRDMEVEMLPIPSSSTTHAIYDVTPVYDTQLINYISVYNSYGWHFICNYLATINNLDVPVTKTAEKTMKITYILQEE